MNLPTSVKNKYHKRAGIFALSFSAIFLLSCLFGKGVLQHWGTDGLACYPYVGCSDGFFGYDALEHFLFGISIVWVLIWIFQRFPKLSLIESVPWKNIVIMLALVALISLMWEFSECIHDYFRLNILHQTLVDVNLHINKMDQPTNIDTMGDFFFAMLGSIISLFFGGRKGI